MSQSDRPRRTEGEPHDRLTRICAAMTAALDGHPEATGEEKCIVFLQDGKTGGLEMHGYEDDSEALADVLAHLRAIFRANGSDLQLHTLGGDGG